VKKIYIFSILILSFFGTFLGLAEENSSLTFAPGMESIEIGPGVSRLAPEGMEKYEHKGLIILEDIDEYIVRRFHEVEKRLGKLEEEVEKLKKVQKKKKSEVLNSE